MSKIFVIHPLLSGQRMINAFSAKQSIQINLKIKCNVEINPCIVPQFNGRNPKDGEG